MTLWLRQVLPVKELVGKVLRATSARVALKLFHAASNGKWHFKV